MAHRAQRDENAVNLWPGQAPGARGDGLEDCPRMTPYLLDGPGPHAGVIVCPGGGYAHRADHEGDPIARWLNGLGLAAFVLDYRVAPYHHPVPLQDAQRAIRLVRHNAAEWRVDPQRVGILGFSAGGHLAISTATIFDSGNPEAADPVDRRPSRPDALIACYAVVTMGPRHHHMGCRNSFLGPDAPESLVREVSLEMHVTDRTPPAFIWHTAEDAAVPVQNALMLAEALADHNIPFALHVFPKGRHGLGLAQADPVVGRWTSLCADWLHAIGFLG